MRFENSMGARLSFSTDSTNTDSFVRLKAVPNSQMPQANWAAILSLLSDASLSTTSLAALNLPCGAHAVR